MKFVSVGAQRPVPKCFPILRAAYYFFLSVGILAIGYVGYVVVEAHAYQARELSKFENATQSQKEAPHLLVEGGVIGEIQVPRLNLKAIVVQGDSHTILRHAVGHIPDTALPGQSGNVALAGHRDTFFRPLQHIRLGDTIHLKTLDGDFSYQVESTAVVPASAVEVLSPTEGHTLTLITCFPFDYIGAAPNRFIVRAREVPAEPSQLPAP
ncbi:MAG TPA: class D sortase [Candidatus Acidoferrum sp.]|nr:class D sortase [Candidatus Acidoferrum sp.]